MIDLPWRRETVRGVSIQTLYNVKTHATPNPTSLESSRTDLVLDAMRLAERAHRQRNHFRKAPEGEDRPAYFLHLAEVAWMAEEAGLDPEVVATGFLHDIIEDCGYTRERHAGEIGSARVAERVEWVSEPDRDHSWETRNDAYLKRMQGAPAEVLALSCADKTSNLRDMNRLLVKGHATDSFTSTDVGPSPGAVVDTERFHHLTLYTIVSLCWTLRRAA